MGKGKLILICQSGGEFVTEDDGTMSYNGGEANAENITSESSFNDIKLKLAEACNFDQKTVTIKYFLPGNKKNLIVMKNDKDVKRMIDFHGDAITAEVFVTGTPGFDRTALDTESNRENVTKKDEPLKKDETKEHKNKKTKKDDKAPASPPAKRTRSATAVVSSSKSSDKSDGATSDSSNESSSISDSDSDSDPVNETPNSNSDSGSDYLPKRPSLKKNKSLTTSPADAVKKRRRTPSWKFGSNGRPTIVSGAKPEKKNTPESSQRKSRRLASKDKKKSQESDQDQESEPEPEENLSLTVCDEYALPETTVDTWKSGITGIGQEFASVNEFRAALKKYAIANRFGYRFKKNDTSRAIGKCAAEGCSWKFYAAWVPSTKCFTIKTMNSEHTCEKDSRKSTHPAKNWLVGAIKDRLKESPYLKPKEIANGLLQDFGVEFNYTQVWRGIGDAREQLHGSLKESYNKLPWFCEKILETNPGSVVKLVIGDKKRFKSLFVSFHALKKGFKNCRPLFFLESVSMKSRYGESLLLAIAVDGNDGFVPVAFGVVDVEDDDTWRWFLKELKRAILDTRAITFVVDRDKNLKKLVLEVFENAFIGYSIHHLLASFKRHMKGPFHGDGKGFLPVHFLAAAQSVRPVGFKKSTEHIKTISTQGHDWVMKIEPENYASCYFKGERYNYITEDVGESYGKLMEDYRHLPILQKLNSLIKMMIDDVEDAKVDGSVWTSQLTSLKEKELVNAKTKALGLKVLISSDVIFEVREESTHVVNVGNWSCTCMGWKEIGLPCQHAVAVLNLIGKNVYEFCSSYFTADAYRLTYSESIRPVPIDGPLEGRKLDFGKVEGEKMEVEKDEGEKMEVEKDEGGNVDGGKDEGEKMDVEKDSNVDTEMVEGGKVDEKKDEGSKVENEKDEGNKAENEKDEGSKVVNEKDEGGKMDNEKDEGSKAENEKDEGSKVINEKDEGGKVDNEKDEGGKVENEKDKGDKAENEKDKGYKVENEKDEGVKRKMKKTKGSKEENEKDKGSKEENEKDEGSKAENEKYNGSKEENEKDKGSKAENEKDKGSKAENEKDKGSKAENEKDKGSKAENEKDEGSKVENEKDEGRKLDVEKDDSGNVDTEMGEGMKLDEKKDEGGKVENEKDEGSKVEKEKDEGSKVENEKDEGGKVESEKEEGEKLDVEKDEVSNADTAMVTYVGKKDEGSKAEKGKEEGGKVDGEKDERGRWVREEHEDPNVFVLPPIPVKGTSMVKKENEGVEIESENKRKVTCSKCKQQGHYKKSCKT